jgi:Domain of unknown function (DUF3425)
MQIEQLTRENDSLKSQVYGPYQMLSAVSSAPSLSTGSHSRYGSLSPSIPSQLDTAVGNQGQNNSLSSDLVQSFSVPSATSPSLASSSMAMTMSMLSQPLLMPTAGMHQRHHSHGGHSPVSSSSMSANSPELNSMNVSGLSQSLDEPNPYLNNLPATMHSNPGGMLVVVPYDRNKVRSYLKDLFRPLFNPSVYSPESHLAALKAMSPMLPKTLKPTATQLTSPHDPTIDMIPSATLRDRLINFGPEVAKGFLDEVFTLSGDIQDDGQIIIWGSDFLNEMAWEISSTCIDRWSFVLGREWISHANFWRRQRGDSLLSEPMDAGVGEPGPQFYTQQY